MIDNDLTDITVVGGGIVGICCALALVESGAKVLLIDRDEPGQGASYGNAGVVDSSIGAGFMEKHPRMVAEVGWPDSDQTGLSFAYVAMGDTFSVAGPYRQAARCLFGNESNESRQYRPV